MPQQQTIVDLKNAAILGALGNVRTYYQYEEMYKALATGECPFCHPEKWRNPEILRIGNWILKFNDMPYANSKHHLVIVYVGHVTDPSKLTRVDGGDFFEIIARAEEMFSIKGCGIAMRRGEIAYTAGTIAHIHAHIQEVELGPDGLPVGELKATFAKDRKKLLQCKAKVELFEQVRQGNFTGVQKGFVVYGVSGFYLTHTHTWECAERPEKADIITMPISDILRICENTQKIGVMLYEVLKFQETGVVLYDGPFELEWYHLEKRNFTAE